MAGEAQAEVAGDELEVEALLGLVQLGPGAA